MVKETDIKVWNHNLYITSVALSINPITATDLDWGKSYNFFENTFLFDNYWNE